MAVVVPSPFADPNRPTRAELRRWQAGYARVASRQRELAQAGGVDRKRAVELSRDMIDVALAPGNRTVLKDAVRLRGEASVRRIWRRLRSGLLP
jgi:hypothetical protein